MPVHYEHNDGGYVMLMDIPVDSLADSIKVQNLTLLKKSELHISLISAKKIAAIIDGDKVEEIYDDIVNEFEKFTKNNSLKEYSITGPLRLVKRKERVTVIVMAQVENLDKFFDLLREKYKVNIPTQPMHITLYTLQPDVGIGILSDEELIRDSQEIKIPELEIF